MRSTAPFATRGLVDPAELAVVAPERDPRILVGMLEQAGLVERGLDSGRRMCVELLATPLAAAARVERLLERARLVAESRADRVVAFAETRACRHAQVAEHFGELFSQPCAMCDVCAPQAGARRAAREAPPLPDEVGTAIVGAVSLLRWRSDGGLVATLRGSLKAPRRRAVPCVQAARGGKRGRRPPLGSARRALGSTRREDDAGGYRVLVVDPSVLPRRFAPCRSRCGCSRRGAAEELAARALA